MREVPSEQMARYETIKVLGRGSVGEVILARDIKLGRLVAIKRASPSANIHGLTGFRIDARAAALHHPNIPVVYEVSGSDEPPFLAMEYVEGETLDKILNSARELDLVTKLRIIEQVCTALGHAHKNGIIHLNMKPANIIIRSDGTAKVTDFGIAKPDERELSSRPTRVSRIGSLGYIAPESVHGGKVDGRADIFSAGGMLFKLLTGKEPPAPREAAALLKMGDEIENGRGTIQEYPPALHPIVQRALARDPDRRYQTAEDFAHALHAVIEELKSARVIELLSGAEDLILVEQFAGALELLDEAIKLDPAHAKARKLRNSVRGRQERIRRSERLNECFAKSEEALQRGDFDRALSHLQDARNLDAASDELKAKIEAVEGQKLRFENSTRAVNEAEEAKARGDVTGAQRIVSAALKDDPGEERLRLLKSTLHRETACEAHCERQLRLHKELTEALLAREYGKAEMLLSEAKGIDPGNAITQKLERDLLEGRKLEQRQIALEEIEGQVQECMRANDYERAAALLDRALDRMPKESLLHRLRAEVESQASEYDIQRIVDLTIAQAHELFPSSPMEALNVVQKALENMPGEKHLVSCERSLRRQIKAGPADKLHVDAVQKARELIEARQFERAIGILETYQSEAGQHPDIYALLAATRSEFARRQRGDVMETAPRS